MKDDLIDMARAAGLTQFVGNHDQSAALERFAKMVVSNVDPSSMMSYKEGYDAGRDAGRAEQQADMESLYAMYKQACAQRDILMDQQRAQVAAMRGQLQ